MKYLVWNCLRAVLPLALLAVSGCSSLSGDDLRLTRYRPVEHGRKVPAVTPVVPAPVVLAPPPAVTQPVATTGVASVKTAQESSNPGIGRTLRKGDKIVISRKGIVHEDEIKDVIDENGEVNLPLIDRVKMEGLTTSEAEELIEKRYIDGQIYRKITIIVVAQEDEYYIRGEVTRPGKYPLSTGVTLLRAVSAAGGYTDFANPRKITIMRGDRVTVFDGPKLEASPEVDPQIHPDDVIVVPQKWKLGS